MHLANTSLFYKELGKLIRKKRDEMDLSQAQLASKLGLTRASVANIETGRQKMLAHQLQILANVLDLSVDGLLQEASPASRKLSAAELPLQKPEDLSPSQKTQVFNVFSSAPLTSIKSKK